MGQGASVEARSPEEAQHITESYLAEARAKFTAAYLQPRAAPPPSLAEYEPVRTIGTGSFGRVMLVRHTPSGRPQALKILEKERVVRLKQVEHTNNEKNILAAIDLPFIVNLLGYWQDNCNLYMGLEYVSGGELFGHLRTAGRYSEDVACFYGAQIVLALQYLQSLNIVYRDLKPENLLFNERGYLKITDFGFAKYVEDQTWTLCGTPEYLAPEIILMRGYGKAVDWWALGVLLYEMAAGYPPFYAENPLEIYQKIIVGSLRFPQSFSPELRRLLESLLQSDTTRRIGTLRHGAEEVKGNAWFGAVDWIKLFQQEVPAPYTPPIAGPDDSSLYERYREAPIKTSEVALHADDFASF